MHLTLRRVFINKENYQCQDYLYDVHVVSPLLSFCLYTLLYIQVRALHCTSDHLEIQHLTELGEVKPEFILIPNWYEVHFKCSTQNI